MIILYCLVYLFIGWISSYIFDDETIFSASLVIFIWPILVLALLVWYIMYWMCRLLFGLTHKDTIEVLERKLHQVTEDRGGFINS